MSKTLLDAPIYINTYLGWNPQKECFCLKERYTLKMVLERKYKVRL